MQVEAHHGILGEWRRPVPTDVRSWPVYALVVKAAFALIRSRESRRTVDVVLLVLTGGLALTAVRHSVLFAIVVELILDVGGYVIWEEWTGIGLYGLAL